MADIDIDVGKEPLINQENNNNKKIFNRCVSHQQDELHSFRKYLRWMCVDHSSPWTAILSWTMFVVFTLVVPAISHFLLACADCDSYHSRPYDSVVQLSLSSVATVSFLCLTRFVSKYGLRRFLFFDKLWDESETVRRNYTNQLNTSLHIVSYFVIPCFSAMSAYKIWWYASGGSRIPFLGNVVLSDTVACIMELCSWLYRTTVIFLVCVLFRLICHLQILRLQDFAKLFQIDSDVGSILSEHLRIRRHLRIISHRYRSFILCLLILVTGSQFSSLLITTKAYTEVNMYRAGELAVSFLQSPCSFLDKPISKNLQFSSSLYHSFVR
ncbi:hypothetical protein ISN45_Aa01g034700 [Arabidopsis thaliana x Arabidopsis arenosa]|uniref:Uncharacterized protein n=1 Tax=Arabidopsis thaliana x Arabidopsis arenosa TaxID=1240361 RepID=A0A8T2CCK2_9BRAS|nr:hypothetical protein ISN45_Aa01g034700 [Arabidopsis thaliana x Arabidopsis arenosa]